MRWRSSRPITGALAAAVGLAVLLVPGVAHALLSGSTLVMNPTYSSLQVAPATGLASVAACGPTGSLTATVSLTWTASTTSRLTSVQVLRRVSPAAFSVIATLPATAVSHSDTNLLTATIYDYAIRSNVGSFSTDTPTTTTTTPAVCL